jgi:hypothetical protein
VPPPLALSTGANLLAQFPTSCDSDETPLLVSEGGSAGKLISISRSDYLSFAYRALVDHAASPRHLRKPLHLD